MLSTSPTLIALIHGPDQPGLVARTAGWIFARGGTILHADQHRDMEKEIFFQRIEWVPAPAAAGQAAGKASVARPPEAPTTTPASANAGAAGPGMEEETAAFVGFAADLGMKARIASSIHRPRGALFVSKADHCFHDLVLRWRAGEFPCVITAVISNHDDLAEAARGYGLAFHHIPVSEETKAAGEARQLALLRELDVELVVLARYMQVLSADFLTAFGRPVINIHHSFLPAFVGARPYQQAFDRGVKVIGATAHFVTENLDEGPILVQQVIPVDHTHTAFDLSQAGRDVEQMVLARALRLVLEDRVFLCGNRSIIFD